MYQNKRPLWLPATFPARLVLLLVLVFALVSSGSLYLIHSTMRGFTEQTADEELRALTENIAHIFITHSRKSAEHTMVDLAHAWGDRQIAFRILESNGKVILSSSGVGSWPIDWPPAGTNLSETVSLPDSRMAARILSHTVTDKKGTQYTFQAVRSLKKEYAFLARLDHSSFVMFCLTLLALGVAGWFAASFAMRGIARITHAAEVMSSGVFLQDIPPSGVGTDIDRLVTAFNKSSRRLSALITELSETNDYLAHDLKTPITQIRATAELLLVQEENAERAKKLGDIVEGCDELQVIINTTLDAAEIKAGIRGVKKEQIPVKELFETIRESYAPLADDKNITFNITPVSNSISADKQLLLRALANVTDNAIKFTPEGGHVSIWYQSTPVSDIIAVSDSGPGTSTKEQQHLFSRFYRADSSRTIAGSGLGLYIAKTIMQAHGGTITARNNVHSKSDVASNTSSSGMTFRLHIPSEEIR